jgi:LPS export ABC transporter protein LptC
MLSLNKIKIYFGIPASLVLAGFLFSCVNDLNQIRRVTYDPKAPDEVIKDMEVFYTDDGYAKVRIYAKLAETYSNPEQVTKLKDGLKVDFYNEEGQIVSTLTALYGEIRTSEGKMLVKDSVRLYNYEKDQRMETEELNWNQKDSIIYSDKSVVVKTATGILYGQGVRTKQDFSTYSFLRPTGRINLDK